LPQKRTFARHIRPGQQPEWPRGITIRAQITIIGYKGRLAIGAQGGLHHRVAATMNVKGTACINNGATPIAVNGQISQRGSKVNFGYCTRRLLELCSIVLHRFAQHSE